MRVYGLKFEDVGSMPLCLARPSIRFRVQGLGFRVQGLAYTVVCNWKLLDFLGCCVAEVSPKGFQAVGSRCNEWGSSPPAPHPQTQASNDM